MNYSKYQIDIFDKGINTNSNIAINATAGSGKTTTIIELTKKILDKNKFNKVLFLAFNKSIVEELKSRLPEDTMCKTIHSLGMNCMMKYFSTTFKLDEFKTFKICDSIIKDFDIKLNPKELIIFKYTISDIIRLMRLTLCSNDFESISKMVRFYDIDCFEPEINVAIKTFEKLQKYNNSLSRSNNLIDYTDMIYIPATNENIILPKFDTILIDELQDLNRAQHLFISKLKKINGRTIGVGDKRQAIYSFAGADINSFEQFENSQNTVSMPLYVSYRCPKNIVLEAKKVFPEIESHENSKDGVIRKGTIDEIGSNDMVICRNCKPLVLLFLKLLERNKKSFIKGSDIENGILKLVSKFIEHDKVNGITLLKEMLANLETQLTENGVKLPKNHNKYRSLKEKIEIINLIAKDCNHMVDVEKKIKYLFEDKKDAIQLMTVHKSKGLENNRVFFVEKFNGEKLIPSKYATQGWEITQEKNLLFVALTRSKSELIFIDLKDND